MAVYPNMLTTQAGYDLISRANTTKKALIITRAALGKGDLGSNNIVSLTDLIDPVMDNLPLTNSIDHQNGHYEVEASIDNSELDTGFWAKEMGIFAKVDGDATDTLYAYTNGGIYVPYVNDKSKPDIQLVQCDFIVGNATNVEATIDVKVYITEGRLQKHNTDPTAHPDKLVNLTTNGDSLRAVKGDGTNIDVVVPYSVGTTQVKPKDLGSYATNKISDIRDLFNNELADMYTKGCSVRFIRLGADLSTIYNNWAKNWDATMSPWGTIYGVISLLGDDTYANVELTGYTGTTVLLQRIAGNWKTAETKVYTDGMLNVADTLKLQSNELTLDMGGGTQTNINIGLTPKNYSGSGFTYTFYNGKNSLADLVAKTQAVTDNSNNVATTAFVQSIKSELVDNAPATLATLGKVATSINNDANYAQTVNNALALKAPLASPALTGTPTAPTAAPGTNTTQLATTAFVQAIIASLSSGNIGDFVSAAQSAATSRIVGDMSNSNSWWFTIPAIFGKICIQGGRTSNGRTLYVNFPISFQTIYNISVSMLGMATGSQSCVYVDEIHNNSFRTGSYDAGNGMYGVMWIAYGLV